jgi:hypothetical protein
MIAKVDLTKTLYYPLKRSKLCDILKQKALALWLMKTKENIFY